MSCKVIKFNRFNMKQDRDLLISNLYLYNIKKNSKPSQTNSKEIKKPVQIGNIQALTYSSVEGVNEFVVHIRSD